MLPKKMRSHRRHRQRAECRQVLAVMTVIVMEKEEKGTMIEEILVVGHHHRTEMEAVRDRLLPQSG